MASTASSRGQYVPIAEAGQGAGMNPCGRGAAARSEEAT